MASVADIRTYVYGATYDSWNRVRTMTYPDGEVVTYHYNAAGQVESMTSNKQGRQSVIVDRIGYDKEGHTVYTKLGNGTETTYTYDKQRERLQVMNLTADGQTVMENRYRYDAVDNILGITNAADPTSLTKLNKAKLGGRSSHTYEYDELNRLVHANGKAKRASYDMVMSFGRMSEPLTKVQKVDSTTTAKSYNFAYKYEDSNHPTAPTQIGHDHYTYDANGNPTLVTNDSTNTTREMYWDEDNRLMVLSDNGKTSRYTYNAAGERIMKSYGTMEGVYINGAPQGITFHETDNFTLYPASILSVNKNRFTKHYFIGERRIASRIGTGLFNNVYGRNGSYVTAGQQDYAERMNQIQKQKEAYYKQQGIAPGVPTMKGAYGDPENTKRGYNSIIDTLGNHDVPQGWIQTPHPNTTPDTNPGPPVSWNDPSNPDDPQAGYGYIPNDTTKEETFFYHSDHLGSTSYITDDHANITQYDAYLPYGELLVDEHSSSEDLPYKFNGKQFDEETGLYYYGARYMNPVASIWYGVDPLAEKYVEIGAYIYCHNNPIILFDPDGMEDKDKKTKALEAISLFEHTKTETVFKNIPKEQFIRDLRNQINNPNTVQQGRNGTCGAAAISKYLAEEQPDLYTRTAISLYTSGVSTNRGVTLSVTDEMKKGTVGDLHSAGLSSVDAIMQGAITNRNNGMLEVNTFKGESGINSFMWPSFISSFLKDFAGVHVRSIGAFPTMGALRSIDYNKYFVIGLVHNEGGHITDGLYPNHYVQLLGFNRQNYASFWTWGENRPRKSHVFGLMHGIHQIYMIKR